MTRASRLTNFLAALILVAAAVGFSKPVEAAGSATLTLTPASGSFQVNTTLAVEIYENSGAEQVNAVQADLAYNASQLEFQSIDNSGSGFGTDFIATGGGGNVSIVRGSTTSVSGSQKVSKVNFKVLGSSGTTSITFRASSAIVRTSDTANIWDESPTGGTYTMTAPPATPPGGGTGSGTGSGSSNNSSNNTQPTSPSGGTPATEDQPAPTTPEVSATTYMVAVRVVDAEDNPQGGVDTSLDGETVQTDAQGIASFTGVTPGEHTIEALGISQTITVIDDGNAATVQQFEIRQQAGAASNRFKELLPFAAGGLVILAGLGFLTVKKLLPRIKMARIRSGTPRSNPPAGPAAPPSVGGPTAGPPAGPGPSVSQATTQQTVVIRPSVDENLPVEPPKPLGQA